MPLILNNQSSLIPAKKVPRTPGYIVEHEPPPGWYKQKSPIGRVFYQLQTGIERSIAGDVLGWMGIENDLEEVVPESMKETVARGIGELGTDIVYGLYSLGPVILRKVGVKLSSNLIGRIASGAASFSVPDALKESIRQVESEEGFEPGSLLKETAKGAALGGAIGGVGGLVPGTGLKRGVARFGAETGIFAEAQALEKGEITPSAEDIALAATFLGTLKTANAAFAYIGRATDRTPETVREDVHKRAKAEGKTPKQVIIEDIAEIRKPTPIEEGVPKESPKGVALEAQRPQEAEEVRTEPLPSRLPAESRPGRTAPAEPIAPPVPIPGIKGAGAGKGIGDLLSKPKTLPIERLLEIQQQAKQFPKGDAWVSQAKENLVKGKHTEVIIGFDDGGKPYIRDGNSRIAAAKELKLSELPVEIKLEDYPAFAPSAPQKDLLQKGIVKIRESEFDPAYIRFSFSPGKIRIAENRTGDISETSLFHGTSPAAAMRILQEGRITAKESSLNPMGGGSGRVVSLSPNKHISATFGDVVFEIDKATTKTFNPPEILLKQLGAGTELRTAESVPLENIKQVHIIADSVKGVREDILDVVRADRWNTKTEKLGTLETLANQLSERGFKVIVHTKPKAFAPSAPPAKAIDTTIIKQKLQDSSDNVMDEMLDTMLGVEGLHKFYGQETPNEPPEGMPGEIPVQ